MAFEYIPGDSILHKLDVRVKLLLYLTILFLCMSWSDPIFNAALLLVQLSLISLSRIPWEKITDLLKVFLSVGVVYSFISLFFLTPPNAHIIYWVISIEGVMGSIGMFFRLMNIITMFRIVLVVTPIKDTIITLVKFKFPAEFAMATSIGIGYIPVMIEEVSRIKEALMGRGWEYEYRNPIKRGRAILTRILLPSIKRSITRSNQIALALESRGFSYNVAGRTYMTELKFKGRDYIAMAIIAIIALWGALSGWLFGWGHYLNFSVPLVLRLLRIPA